MDIIQESFQRLFPGKEFTYQTEMQYNRRLSEFNANIRLHQNRIQVNLNLQWKDIDEEIKIGLIQALLLKIFKKKADSQNIELYNNFVKSIPLLTPKTDADPLLQASFQRVNSLFFNSQMEQPNLRWGTASRRKLACYNFHDDSIKVSTLFKESRIEVLDYLMYHELLHKYFKFKHQNGRSSFHTTAFREAERKYPLYESMEKEINKITRKKASVLDFFR
ncbi:M48 family metallopeptidase [Candidatus Woesearchaeota archaeon]|nr:M48 family metallopeptidase [Candidatus Woesearchaeota archaeon]